MIVKQKTPIIQPNSSNSNLNCNFRKSRLGVLASGVALTLSIVSPDALAQEISRAEFDALMARIEQLESENRSLREEREPQQLGSLNVASSGASSANFVSIASDYNFKVLDHAENTNTKQLLQLRALQSEELNGVITLGGQVTALANYQEANEDTKFGWLMRHPTAANQIGTNVSEAVVHSANLNMTAKLSEDFTAYLEMLYNPEQNFAANSTITGLPRNNVNMRKAYVMWGNLDKSPLYASIGKMDIPFGLNDTVSPFTNSSNWHAFAGLAYGGLLGFASDNLHVRAMAVQGGAQFRNANTPIEGSNVPSKLNNFAIDANYKFPVAADTSLLIGASYQYGTGYCQSYIDTPATAHSTFPALIPGVTRNTAAQGVKHFNSCEDNNDGASVYAQLSSDKLLLIAEYTETLGEWPGTFNPYIPEFQANENSALTVGARYDVSAGLRSDVELSAEFSRFEAGASGSSWEKQDQLVLGVSYFVKSNVNLFAEAIRVDGWVPLNFLSGGNPGSLVGTSWSSQSSFTNIMTVGLQTAF